MSTNALVVTLPLTTVTADDLKQELINRLSVKFADWTDTQASNNMIMLLEVLAAITELDYAYINRMAREAFIQFALDYRNVTAHARALSYIPGYQSPSIVAATIISASAVTANTTIPVGSQFNCSLSGVIYQTIADVLILQGQTQSNPVILWQQQSWLDAYTGTGSPNQQLTLNKNVVLPDSVSISVNGVFWSFVDNFVDSISTDLVYTRYIGVNGACQIVFGNGINGTRVPVGAAVNINYNIGGGSVNAIGPGQLTTCISDVVDGGNGTLLSLSAYNNLPATPGSDIETVAQIRAHAVKNLLSLRCLLTLDDIENAVGAVPGVQSVLAVDWNTLPALPQYLVEIFVVPVGLGQPSQDLINRITTLITITKPLVLGQSGIVAGPTYMNLDFNLQVYVLPGYNVNAVQNSVRQLLINLFAGNFATFIPTFGMPIYMSVLTSLIQQVLGVRNLVILSPGDLQLTPDQYPVLRTVTFTPTQ